MKNNNRIIMYFIRHGERPSSEQTAEFIKVCTDFIFDDNNENQKIGVHCTHGFNRTGFLICAYMVQEMDEEIGAAITSFAHSRNPGIYKDDYVQDLFERYGDSKKPVMAAPPRPEWCFEDDQPTPNRQGASGGWSARNGDDKNRRAEFVKKNPTFMEGVDGVEVVTGSELAKVQRQCQEFCNWNSTGFPGSQPVSMTHNNLNFLHYSDYMVSWKADGARYMMLIAREDEIYFVDRDNCVFKVDGIRFFKRKSPQSHIENTLVDGEMVIDEVSGQKRARYLIYDIVKFEGVDVGGCDFRRRMECIYNELIKPRDDAVKDGRIDKTREPFSVRRKDFWDISATYKLFEPKFTKVVGHEIDGLIFQPVPDAYSPGRTDNILKWKPHTHNSIDFRLQVVKDDLGKFVGKLYVGRENVLFGELRMRGVRDYHNQIVECTFNYEKPGGGWNFMRVRTDKSFPNAYNTAVAVMDSIRNPVTKDHLLQFIESHRWNKSKRPPDQNHHHHQPQPGGDHKRQRVQ